MIFNYALLLFLSSQRRLAVVKFNLKTAKPVTSHSDYIFSGLKESKLSPHMNTMRLRMASASTKLTTTSENASDAILFFIYFMVHLMQIFAVPHNWKILLCFLIMPRIQLLSNAFLHHTHLVYHYPEYSLSVVSGHQLLFPI